MRAVRTVASMLLLAGCQCSNNTVSPAEVGVDAGVPDADSYVVDSGSFDTSAPDTLPSIDAPGPYGGPFVGDWKPLPGLACLMLGAVDASKVFPPLAWVECPTKRAGCRRLVTDWTTGPVRLAIDSFDPVTRGEGGQRLIRLIRTYPVLGSSPLVLRYLIETIVALDSGVTLAAVGTELTGTGANCVGGLVAGPLGIGVTWQPFKSPSTYLHFRRWGAAEPTFRWVDHSELVFAGTESTDYLRISGTALHLGTFGPVAVLTPDLVTLTKKVTPTEPMFTPVAVTGGSLSIAGSNADGLDFTSDAGMWTRIWTIAPGRTINWISIDREGPETVVWIESASSTGATPELWEMPVVTKASDAKPRKVGSASRLGLMMANAGMALTIVDPSTAHLVRRTDGVRWTIKVEPGEGFVDAAWVDADEVWLVTASADRVGTSPNPSWGILRIRRDSLGPPS